MLLPLLLPLLLLQHTCLLHATVCGLQAHIEASARIKHVCSMQQACVSSMHQAV